MRAGALLAATLAIVVGASLCPEAAAEPSAASQATSESGSKIDPSVHEWFSSHEDDICLLFVTLDIGCPLQELPWVQDTPEVRRWEEAAYAHAHGWAVAAVEEDHAALKAARERRLPAADAVVPQLLATWRTAYAHNLSVVQEMLGEVGDDLSHIEGVARVEQWLPGTMSPEVLVWSSQRAVSGIADTPRVLRARVFSDMLAEPFDLIAPADDDPSGDYYKVHRDVTQWMEEHPEQWCRVDVDIMPGKPLHDNRWRADTAALALERGARNAATQLDREHGETGSVTEARRDTASYDVHRWFAVVNAEASLPRAVGRAYNVAITKPFKLALLGQFRAMSGVRVDCLGHPEYFSGICSMRVTPHGLRQIVTLPGVVRVHLSTVGTPG